MSSCRRTRELLELFRYGRPDERSEGQLRHLGVCETCRGEVGCDRQLVRQLQLALEARVEGAAPSPAAWASIRRQAELQRTERAGGWVATLVALTRGVGGVAAVSALAVVLVVFGGVTPRAVPADGGATAPATVAPSVRADVGGLLPQVPAERLEAPSRPGTAEMEIRVVPPLTGKRGGLAVVAEPAAPAEERPVASVLERFLQGETAPAIIVAWIPVLEPTARPGGTPL